jgi:hypothetical protein
LAEKMGLELVLKTVAQMEWRRVALMVARKVGQQALGQVELLEALKVGCWGFHLVEKMALELVIGKVGSMEWRRVVLMVAMKADQLVSKTVAQMVEWRDTT